MKFRPDVTTAAIRAYQLQAAIARLRPEFNRRLRLPHRRP